MSTPVGGIVQGVVSAVGAARNTLEERRFERRAQDFAGSAYQRTVADLKAAGLNPMLAFGGGGVHPQSAAKGNAKSGGGEGVGAAITGAQVAREQIANMKAQNRLLDLEGDKSEVEKAFYTAVLPLAQGLAKRMGAWSAESAGKIPDFSKPVSPAANKAAVEATFTGGKPGEPSVGGVMKFLERVKQGLQGISPSEGGEK